MGILPGKLRNPVTTDMAGNSDSVIDLTNCSFTLADHCRLNNVIINLDTDDSFHGEENIENAPRARKRRHLNRNTALDAQTSLLDLCTSEPKTKRRSVVSTKANKVAVTEDAKKERVTQSLGTCPICFEDFCGQPLSSTKCGHVFCQECLKAALKIESKCPTCRTILKGKDKFHALFL